MEPLLRLNLLKNLVLWSARQIHLPVLSQLQKLKLNTKTKVYFVM